MTTPRIIRISLISLLVYAGVTELFLIAVTLLGPAWHLLYGNEILFEGWKVPAPQSFCALDFSKTPESPTMWKMDFGIPLFDAPYGHITLISTASYGFKFSYDIHYDKWEDGVFRDARDSGHIFKAEHQFNVGDSTAYCLEFDRSGDMPNSKLRCVVDGSYLALFYEGDPKYIGDAYATIQGITHEVGNELSRQ